MANIFDIYLNKRYKLLLFSLFFAIIFLNQIFLSDCKFYYDSLDYWNRANDFIKDNHFSLLNYNEPLRGYLFSFLLFVIKILANFLMINDILLLFIFSALFISYVIVFILPVIAERLFNIEIKVHQTIIFFALFYLFWNGYFFYPLTDIFSIFFILISLNFYLKFKIQKKGTLIYLILSGMFLFASAQLRPIYLISILSVLFVIFILFIFRKNKRKELIFTFLGLCFGFLIIASPQIYINKNLYGTFNPLAETSKAKITSGANLYLYQLRGGIHIQRYETNVGTRNYDSANVGFLDNKIQGQRLYKLLQENKNTSISNLAKIILTNSGDFIMIYSRHFFNGLDIWYNNPYVIDIYTPTRPILSFLNYTLIFFVLLFIFKNKMFFQDRTIKIGLLLFLSPIIFLIPTAIEVRFFLPLYLYIYFIFSYYNVVFFIKDNFKKLLREYWYKYLIFILICFILSQYTFSFITYN